MGERVRNYSRELEVLIKKHQDDGVTPKLLLHSCCAPCSSAVLEYISEYFSIYLLYYNPNIAPESEFDKRRNELERLISEMELKNPVELISCEYRGEDFMSIAKGLENEPEGGERCLRCYRLRLAEAAKAAVEHNCDYFTTTLSISPLKKSQALNTIGEELAEEYGVKHLPSDFKKKDGYKRSIILSEKHDLYRQDYCGCIYSKAQRERKDKDAR